ncbi:hypothetical protein ACVWW6_000508 [Bradyrhizobium sp. USDA 3311]|uniref:hypothetical protein n=1 Tax=Bradyrhizobium sp. LCT2 TaxID=2493093 RepID=UPI001375372B|nr:hypothetical protein [Bradyrhizobium sp. LCT2]
MDELRLGGLMPPARSPFGHQAGQNPAPVGLNTSLSLDFCNCRSDASLSMKDDRKPVESSSRSAVALRRGWHHAAAFAAQVFEIVPKTKYGHVHIATPCKAVTEADHVWSARHQDFLGPPISRAGVVCAPRRCDRDCREGGCTAIRIASPAHSSVLIHQTSLKPHILHYCYLPREGDLFTGLGRLSSHCLAVERKDYGPRIIVAPRATR